MDLINQLTGLVDQKYITLAIVAYLASQAMGRIYAAVVNGGGLRSILSAVWLGTNTPKQKESK